MKYQDMSEEQRDAFRSLYLNIVSIKSQEEQQLTQQFYRFLVLGNGAALILLCSFLGTIINGNLPYTSEFISPLFSFFIGMILAALVYFPLAYVASQATIHMGNQVSDFFLNKLDMEEFQAYGFTEFGSRIVVCMLILSFLLFCYGALMCILILQNAVSIS